MQLAEKSLANKQYDADTLLLATSAGAVMIELEENSGTYIGPGIAPDDWVDEASVEWLLVAEPDNPLTAFNIIPSPWEETELLAMTGYEDGQIDAWIVDDDKDGNFTKESKFKGSDSFVGPISPTLLRSTSTVVMKMKYGFQMAMESMVYSMNL